MFWPLGDAVGLGMNDLYQVVFVYLPWRDSWRGPYLPEPSLGGTFGNGMVWRGDDISHYKVSRMVGFGDYYLAATGGVKGAAAADGGDGSITYEHM